MNRIRQFMYGRYGADQLGIALIVLGCIVTFSLSFIRVPYYRLIGLIPYGFFLFRALSKNIEKRRAENEKFLKVWYPCCDFFKRKSSQFQDKEHKYYKCPGCSRTLRVPKGKGKIEISCPHCGRKFKKRT